MPWTVDDVERHNKGLTDKEKDRWVKIANSVLKICKSRGGGSECDAKAIQVANGVIKKTRG